MIRCPLFFKSSVFLALILALGAMGTVSAEPPGPKNGREKAGEKGKGRKGAGEPKLSKQQLDRIRSVLTEVWKDSEVIAARESVHKATESYRSVLEEKVRQVDPEVVALMKMMHNGSKVDEMRRKLPRGLPLKPSWRKEID